MHLVKELRKKRRGVPTWALLNPTVDVLIAADAIRKKKRKVRK
jgi:hypothetical protein